MTDLELPGIMEFSGQWDFLSNFYPVHEYKTVEHYFQACKTNVPEERALILDASTPGRAKRLGRKATLRHDWEGIKIDVMRCLVGIKFFSDQALADRLLATGQTNLYEGNTWGDTFWGIDLNHWLSTGEIKGENVLGRQLMEVRRELQRDEDMLMDYMSEFAQLNQPEVLDI